MLLGKPDVLKQKDVIRPVFTTLNTNQLKMYQRPQGETRITETARQIQREYPPRHRDSEWPSKTEPICSRT